MDKLETIIKSVENHIGNSDFLSYCEVAVSEIVNLSLPSQAIEPLLFFMCEHPNIDYGMPGAFIRFIESFPEDAYVDILIRCIQKQPTEHNTWMLLRIMNEWSSPRQDEYIDIMTNVLTHPNISNNLKETIEEDLQDFIE